MGIKSRGNLQRKYEKQKRELQSGIEASRSLNGCLYITNSGGGNKKKEITSKGDYDHYNDHSNRKLW
jgi:hypothetical protein